VAQVRGLLLRPALRLAVKSSRSYNKLYRKACDIDTHLGTVLAKSYVSAGYQWNVRLHGDRYPPPSGTYYPPGIIQVRLGTHLSWQIVHLQVETTDISQRQTAENIHAAANSCTIQRITG
jgi:hypothetical protein